MEMGAIFTYYVHRIKIKPILFGGKWLYNLFNFSLFLPLATLNITRRWIKKKRLCPLISIMYVLSKLFSLRCAEIGVEKWFNVKRKMYMANDRKALAAHRLTTARVFGGARESAMVENILRKFDEAISDMFKFKWNSSEIGRIFSSILQQLRNSKEKVRNLKSISVLLWLKLKSYFDFSFGCD